MSLSHALSSLIHPPRKRRPGTSGAASPSTAPLPRGPAVRRRGFFAAALGGIACALDASATPRVVFGRQQTRIQPSGSLTPNEAWLLAQRMVRLHESGEARLSRHPVFLFRVAGTGSMRPAIGDGDVVIMESAPFEALAPGDVVWWVDDSQTTWNVDGKRGPVSMLHRITGAGTHGWITRGDNNLESDPVLMTAQLYRARVCQVIHCRKQRA